MDQLKILGILSLYLALYIVIRALKKHQTDPGERKTFLVTGPLWASLVFVGNYGFYRMGIMSFIPWFLNFQHTFIWIFLCLTPLYLNTRTTQPFWVQVILFSVFSFIVKYAEQMLFGIWELNHFMFVFKGNFAYVLGWSLMDGLYPWITNTGLRIIGRFVPGLVLVA